MTLRNEIEEMTDLRHTGISMLHEWFETDSSIYLVLEWQQGGDLLQSLLEDGFLEDTPVSSTQIRFYSLDPKDRRNAHIDLRQQF